MNQLPEHRSAANGRTFDRSWNARDFDPIEHHTGRHWSDLALAALAVLIAAAIALGLA